MLQVLLLLLLLLFLLFLNSNIIFYTFFFQVYFLVCVTHDENFSTVCDNHNHRELGDHHSHHEHWDHHNHQDHRDLFLEGEFESIFQLLEIRFSIVEVCMNFNRCELLKKFKLSLFRLFSLIWLILNKRVRYWKSEIWIICDLGIQFLLLLLFGSYGFEFC